MHPSHTKGNCINCHKSKSKKSGLCWVCYKNDAVRMKYVRRREPYEPTMAEVEAIIAEQSKKLPKWWHKSWNPLEDE